ncbi:MAG: hypothetical protein KGL39_15850 [Patescibacteria group bacterium]|nr:hypothetical protein [Patescibacteria group bacterium]
MTLRQWLHGIGAAAIGTASSAVPVVIVDPVTFNFHGGLEKLIEVCGWSAVVAVSAYLAKFPLPGNAGESK